MTTPALFIEVKKERFTNLEKMDADQLREELRRLNASQALRLTYYRDAVVSRLKEIG